MKKPRNKTLKAKTAGWKAPNKRKSIAPPKPEPARTIIVAQEPAAPPVFWPYEIMRWWMPTVRLFR